MEMISNKHGLSAVLLMGILLFSIKISSGGVQYSANVLSSGIVDNTAIVDIPVSGTVTGNYTHTHASDNVYESIQEDAITTGGSANSSAGTLLFEGFIDYLFGLLGR